MERAQQACNDDDGDAGHDAEQKNEKGDRQAHYEDPQLVAAQLQAEHPALAAIANKRAQDRALGDKRDEDLDQEKALHLRRPEEVSVGVDHSRQARLRVRLRARPGQPLERDDELHQLAPGQLHAHEARRGQQDRQHQQQRRIALDDPEAEEDRVGGVEAAHREGPRPVRAAHLSPARGPRQPLAR